MPCLLHCAPLGALLALTVSKPVLAGALPIDLGAAEPFAVLAGSAVTSTGATVLNGDLGVWPSSDITGFPPGLVTNGNIYGGDSNAMQAEAAVTSAYRESLSEIAGLSLTGENLGGMTLVPGVYAFSSSAQLTGTLTLNAAHTADAVFVFQIASTLTTASDATIRLLNFGVDDQIIWQIGSSATLGIDTQFAGDILAMTSITLDGGAGITCGGAMAITGAVTLQDNSVSTSGAALAPRAVLAFPNPEASFCSWVG